MVETRELLTRMVDSLLADGSVRTRRVEYAFRDVERHLFLPDTDPLVVYGGEAVPIKRDGQGLAISSSSEPAIMAVMLEQLGIDDGHRVLEIGTGSGYNAALLDSLAGPSGKVTTLDLDQDLVERASKALRTAGSSRVQASCGDGWEGSPDGAPFDRIEVTVGVWDLSPNWVAQLREGGVLVAPLWIRAGVQVSVAFRKHGRRLESQSVRLCGFMRLRGPHAGPEAFASVGSWIVCADEVDRSYIELLGELLGLSPWHEEASEPSEGWFERLALEESRAIRLLTREAPWLDARGIFDPAARALALVEGGVLRGYGAPAALTDLKERLVSGRALDVERLEVEAIPPAEGAGGNWVLRRPSFHFILKEHGPGMRYPL